MPRKHLIPLNLRREFPFLEKDLPHFYFESPNFEDDRRDHMDKISVRVTRADASLMWRGFEWNRRSDVPSELPSTEMLGNKGLGWRRQYLCDTRGKLLLGGYKHLKHVRDIFDQCGFENVDLLVELVITLWISQLEDVPTPIMRTMDVIIYKPPAEGWAELYRTARLTDAVLTADQLNAGCTPGLTTLGHAEYLAVKTRLDWLAQQVEEQVMQGQDGLREELNRSGRNLMMGYGPGRLWVKLDRKLDYSMSLLPSSSQTWINFTSGYYEEYGTAWTDFRGSLAAIEGAVQALIGHWQRTLSRRLQRATESRTL